MIPIINEHSIKDGESVQSFIFRIAAMHGYMETDKDIKGLVGRNGLWHDVPILLPHTRHLFKEFDECYLAKLVKTSDITIGGLKLFSDPTRYTKALKETFYSEAIPAERKGNKKIRFCLECIQSDICKYGFGYFRASWHNAIDCPIHKTNLLNATVNSQDAALNAIHKILRGQYPSKYTVHTPKPYECIDITREQYFKIKFSPCLADRFLHWLRKNYQKLDESVAKRAHLKYDAGFYQFLRYVTGKYKHVDYASLERIIIAMQPKYNTLLQNFMLSNAEIIQVNCGITSPTSLTEPLVIAKGNTCGYCTKYNARCPAAVRLIQSWYLGDRFIRHRNPCDQVFEYSWNWYRIV